MVNERIREVEIKNDTKRDHKHKLEGSMDEAEEEYQQAINDFTSKGIWALSNPELEVCLTDLDASRIFNC